MRSFLPFVIAFNSMATAALAAPALHSRNTTSGVPPSFHVKAVAPGSAVDGTYLITPANEAISFSTANNTLDLGATNFSISHIAGEPTDSQNTTLVAYNLQPETPNDTLPFVFVMNGASFESQHYSSAESNYLRVTTSQQGSDTILGVDAEAMRSTATGFQACPDDSNNWQLSTDADSSSNSECVEVTLMVA